jgi:hypothetical protein
VVSGSVILLYDLNKEVPLLYIALFASCHKIRFWKQRSIIASNIIMMSPICEKTSKQGRILAILGSKNIIDREKSRIHDSVDEIATHFSDGSSFIPLISTITECFDDDLFFDDDVVVSSSVTAGKKNIAKSIILALRHIKSERKEVTQQIESNFEYAKERYTMIENAGSWKANKISAVLAMRRIQSLVEKKNDLNIAYGDLKKLMFKIKQQGIHNFTLSSVNQEISDILYTQVVAQINPKAERKLPNLVMKNKDSDEGLLSELNRKILKQQLKTVKR